MSLRLSKFIMKLTISIVLYIRTILLIQYWNKYNVKESLTLVNLRYHRKLFLFVNIYFVCNDSFRQHFRFGFVICDKSIRLKIGWCKELFKNWQFTTLIWNTLNSSLEYLQIKNTWIDLFIQWWKFVCLKWTKTLCLRAN